MSHYDECPGCEIGWDYDGNHRDEYGNYHPACASRPAELHHLAGCSPENPQEYGYGTFEVRVPPLLKQPRFSLDHEIPEEQQFEAIHLCGATSQALRYVKDPDMFDDEGFAIYSGETMTPEWIKNRRLLHNQVLDHIATTMDEVYAQEWLNEFACCNCCDEHRVRKPLTWGQWTDWRSPISQTANKMDPCLCDCRHVARAICHLYPTESE